MAEPILAAQDTWFSQGGTTVKRASITQIDIKDSYTPTGTVTSSWDASAAKDGSVMAYVEGTKLTIAGNGSGVVYANPDSSYAFSSSGTDLFSALKTLSGGSLFNTSKVENLSFLFHKCSSLSELDVSYWDTSNVNTMRSTFAYCTSIESLDLSNWDTSNVTTMRYMFGVTSALGPMKLKSIGDVSNWDTSNVESMQAMFQYCTNLESLNVSTWDVSKVDNFYLMFAYCRNLESIEVSNWNTASATTFQSMFLDCTGLKTIDVSGWKTNKVGNFSQMFQRCSALTKIIGLENWDTSGIAYSNMYFFKMFSECSSIKYLNLSSFNTSKAYKNLSSGDSPMESMFAQMNKLEKISLGANFNFAGDGTASPAAVLPTPSATYIDGAHGKWYSITDGDQFDPAAVPSNFADTYVVTASEPILAASDSWFTQGGTTVTRSSVTSIDIVDTYTTTGKTIVDQWDASIYSTGTDDEGGPVTAYLEDDGSGNGTYKLTIAGNGTGKVYLNENSRYVFSDSNRSDDFSNLKAVNNANLLDTSNAVYMFGLFWGCSSLNTVDVSNWDTSSVTLMRSVFNGCQSLESIAVDNWDTGNVISFRSMFYNTGLKSLNIKNWNTSNATIMNHMFSKSVNLTSLDLSGWDVGKVEHINSMFADCVNLQTINLDGWNAESLLEINSVFNDCESLQTIDVSGFNVSKVENFTQTFEQCYKLAEIKGLETWDTSSGLAFGGMFENCRTITDLDLSSFDTRNATDFDYGSLGLNSTAKKMFLNNFKLEKITLGENFTFIGDGSIPTDDLPILTTPSAEYIPGAHGKWYDSETGIGYTPEELKDVTRDHAVTYVAVLPVLAAQDTWFSQGGTTVKRASITQIDIKDSYTPTGTVIAYWDASVAKNGSVMAYVEGTKLTIAGDGSGAVYANPDSSYAFGAKTGSDMFNNLVTFNGASLLNTSKVTTTSNMFRNAIKLKSLDVSNWNTGRVTTFTSMFSGNNHVGDMEIAVLDVTNWDTSSATNMDYMFYGCGQLTEMDLSKWDVSKVTTMYHMFSDCFKMERYDFSGWNTASLKNVNGMFNDNKALVSIDVSDWDTGNIFDFGQIFEGCSNLQTINGLDKWDVSKSQSFLQAFKGCSSLTELNLSSWNTSAVTHAMQMFSGCSNLETIYVSNKWNLSNLKTGTYVLDGEPVGYGGDMFAGCTSLVGGAGTTFNSGIVDKTYAKIDGGTASPGYLTDIDDPSQLLIRTGTLHKLGLSVRHVSGSTSKYTPSEMIDALKTTASNITTQSNLIVQIITALEGKAAGSASIMVSHD